MKSQQKPTIKYGTRPNGLGLGWCVRVLWLILCLLPLKAAADTAFIYSSGNDIYGVNLTTQQQIYLTSASLSPNVNALAINSTSGIVYYGDGSSVYYWDPALGTGPNAHALINSFENGFFQAPIQNINSTGGTFLDGKYYIGSETTNGFIEELYELTMSADGRQIASMRALGLLSACNCSQVQIGGFGDIAAIYGASGPEIYGSSADLTQDGQGTSSGYWRFELTTNTWTFLASGSGGQIAESLDGRVFSNVGNSIRELDINTGVLSSQNLLTTNQAIWDFSGGYSYDFGDAPDSYGAASHMLNGVQGTVVFLGQIPPDNESYTQHGGVGGVDGLGDDNNGVGDEDALIAAPALQVGQTDLQFDVTCNAGYVTAWIDFNLNGSFDFAERNENYPVQCLGSSATLTWSGFAIDEPGTSYLRIRAASSANDIYKPTGFVASGEVEDYELIITGNGTSTGNCPAGSESHLYSSTDIPKSYKGNNNNPTISTINIPDSLIISDLNVLNLNASQRSQQQLNFSLRKGTEVVGLYGNTCWNNRSFNISFDDEASGDVSCDPVNGEFYWPDQSLAVFDGIDAQGTWELLIQNGNKRNRGQLNGWELEVCTINPAALMPDVRLGKVVEAVDRNVTITLLLENVGNTGLNDVRLTDELDTVFGVGNYSLSIAPEILDSPAGFTANTAYTGQPGSDELLSSSAILLPGDEVRVKFSVDVGYASAGTDTYSNQALVTALSDTGVDVEDLSSTGFDLTTDQDNPTIIMLSGSIRINGVVFHDTSANASTSHDGVQQLSEPGLAGRAVTVFDVASGTEIATVVTVADGSWTAQLDAVYLNQQVEVVTTPVSTTQFVSESPANSDASNADGRANLILQEDVNANRINIGVVNRPTLALDQTANVVAGDSVQYNHIYTSSTHGNVDFSLTSTSSSPNLTWIETIYHDLNCNEQIDGGDFAINSSMAIAFEESVCLLVEVTSTTVGVNSGSHALDLTANMQAIDLANTSHNVTFTNVNQDVTTVISNGVGNLVLQKAVINISLGGQAVTQNSAQPGHILEYTIAYENTGTGGINDLLINDEVPAYTQIQSASAQCSQTPVSMQCTPGESGSQLNWVFQGVLAPGAGGEVRYRIEVE